MFSADTPEQTQYTTVQYSRLGVLYDEPHLSPTGHVIQVHVMSLQAFFYTFDQRPR